MAQKRVIYCFEGLKVQYYCYSFQYFEGQIQFRELGFSTIHFVQFYGLYLKLFVTPVALFPKQFLTPSLRYLTRFLNSAITFACYS